MRMKKLIALFSALAMLATTVPVLASGEAAPLPPIEPEVIAVDELDVPDVLDVPDMLDAAVAADTTDGTDAADSTPVAQIEGGNSYTSLADAVTNADAGATIKLLANIDIDTSIEINKQLTLDLNNYTLTSSNANIAIKIISGGDLTIVDNSSDQSGKILETVSATALSYAVSVGSGGELTLTSGTVEYSNKRGYAIGCAAGASMTIDGGTVQGPNYAGITNSGTLAINGGAIKGKSYGIYNLGTVTMSGGTVTGSYGIYNSGTVTMDNGKVSSSNGYGIYAQAVPFTLTMNTGEIIGAHSGIYTKESKQPDGTEIGAAAQLTIAGGTVTGNTYYGIRLMKNAKLTIDNGTISGLYGILARENSEIEINDGTIKGIGGSDDNPFGIYTQGNLTVTDGIIEAENGTAISGNGNYHGTVYTINGGTINGGLLGIYHPQDGELYINGGTITGGLTGIEIRAGQAVISGGEITGNGDHLEYDVNGSGSTTIGAGIAVVQHNTKKAISLTVTDGKINGFVPLFEKNVHNNPGPDIEKVTISLTGGVYTNTNPDDPDHQAVITDDVEHYMTGGIYSGKIPYEYIDSEYYRRDWHNGNFEVTKPDFTVVDTARTIDAEIELPDLIQNDGIDGEPFSTYRVVISRASEENVQAINTAKAEQHDDNAKMSAFDIAVEKTDDRGIKENITSGILEQKVRVKLINAPTPLENIKVYYIDKDKNIAKVESEIEIIDNTVTFTAPVLSTYAITYNPAPITANEIADKIGVAFSPVIEGGNQYYITLKPLDEGKKLNRYMSADIVFKNTCSDGRVIYEIEPAEYMNATLLSESGDSREYHFEMDGVNEPDASCVYGEGITIGTITFSGYGTVDFRVDTDYATAEDIEHTVNIVNTAKAADNIVNNYTVKAGTLVVNDDVKGPALKEDEKGTIQDTFSPGKANLTMNIAFNNTAKNNNYEYQDMTITISGGDLKADKVIKLGTEAKKDNTEATVEFNEETSAYKVVIKDELLRNVLYSVKIEGAGYRTAHYAVMMTENKTLNFWNNVKDKAEVIEVGKETGAVTTNFLAGDIVKDNNINLYDLSAVVSYFGTAIPTTAYSEYARYDLNRDGVIDSKDVAYVLVSWGN